MPGQVFLARARAAFVPLAALACAAPHLPTPVALAAPSDEFTGEVEYSVPVPTDDLVPFSRFFVSRFEARRDPDSGAFSLRLTLPRDLVAGRTIEVELVETGRQGNTVSFTKDIGDAVCEVPADWDTARCRYEFNENLTGQFTAAESSAYLGRKYKGDPDLAKRRRVAVDIFRSTEPVGIAGLRGFDAACAACRVGNGVWTTEYTTASGQRIEAELDLARRAGHYFNSQGSGSLRDVTYAGDVATGTWIYGGSRGWFRFVFDADSETFDGTWGQGAPGSPALGTWSGSRLQD